MPDLHTSSKSAELAEILLTPAIDEAPPEVRTFLILLHKQGVQISLSANRRAIKFSGNPMRPENVETYQRLEGQIVDFMRLYH
jgi:hypothetical protein